MGCKCKGGAAEPAACSVTAAGHAGVAWADVEEERNSAGLLRWQGMAYGALHAGLQPLERVNGLLPACAVKRCWGRHAARCMAREHLCRVHLLVAQARNGTPQVPEKTAR